MAAKVEDLSVPVRALVSNTDIQSINVLLLVKATINVKESIDGNKSYLWQN